MAAQTEMEEPDTTPPDYIGNVSKTELLRVIVALSTEVYALADRQRATEAILAANRIDLAALDAPIEPAVYDDRRLAERDNFVTRVFGALAGPAGAA